MGFKFGLIQSIDPTITLICFVVVVAFVVFFEHATEVLEFLLEENQMYSKIVQVIYKELMLMGVISFSIIMYQASKTTATEEETTIIIAIDFAHIILFYMTIFFVFHAVYLIRISIYNHRRNRGYFAKSIKSLADQIEEVEKRSCWSPSKWLYHFDFFSLSSLREKAEFKVVQTIFQALYLVPRNFNYPAYISGCYERYALKTINRSLLSWFILLMAILINYLRLFIGFKCSIHSFSTGAHRLLGSTGDANTIDADAAHEIERENDECRKLTMREFLVVGAMITVYNLGVLIASRIYKWRLVCFSGIKNSTDILGYLQYFDAFEEDFKREIKATKRFSTKQLLSEIDTTLNETEHDEEEETIRFLASLVSTLTSKLKSIISQIRYGFRLLLVSIFCPNRRKQKLLKRNTSMLMSSSPSQSKKGQKLARTSSGVEMNNMADETSLPAGNKSQKASKGLTTGQDRVKHAYEEPSLKEISSKKTNPGIIASLRALFSESSSNRVGHPETADLFRQQSSMLAVMREKRPLVSMQQRIGVNMNRDLPSQPFQSHYHESQDMLFQDVGDAAVLSVDKDDNMMINSNEQQKAEDNTQVHRPQDNAHNRIRNDHKREANQLVGIGSSDDVLSSSEETALQVHRLHHAHDAYTHHSTHVNQDSVKEAKQRRLRAAAASFYYQQRMAHWVIEQQQHQGFHTEEDEEGDDFASDESDSGDNRSSQPHSEDDEDHDYGELILNDPSLHDEKIHNHLRGKITSPKASKSSTIHHTVASPRYNNLLSVQHSGLTTSNVKTINTRTASSVPNSPREVISAPRRFSGGSIASLPSSARGSVSSVRSRTAPSQVCAVRSYRFMKENEEKSSGKSSIKTIRSSAKSQLTESFQQYRRPGSMTAMDELGRMEEGRIGTEPAVEQTAMGLRPPGFPSLTIDLSQLGTISSGSPTADANNADSKTQQHDADQAPSLFDNNHNLEDIDALFARDNASIGMREEVLSDGFSDHAEQGDSDKTIEQEFQSMFFLNRPYLFFRAIELSIMFSCFFMALWVTNMISIVNDIQHADYSFIVLAEIYMILPILLHFYTLPSITETCALITALCQLDMHVTKEVLTDTIETTRLVKTVRRKILARTAHQVMLAERMQRDVRDETQRRELDHCVHRLLHLDQDIHRLQNVHQKRIMMLKRLQRRLHHLQPSTRHPASTSVTHTPTNVPDKTSNPTGLETKIKTLKEEIRLESKRVRHAEKKLSTAQEERNNAWHEFERLKEAIDNTDLEQRRRFIDDLFEEMDQDGSGSIDRDEFREMLRHLSLTLSDHKFRLLFRTVDNVNGDGFIQREELHQFLFPPASVMLLDDAREVGHFHRDESSRREGEATGFNHHEHRHHDTGHHHSQGVHHRRSSNRAVGESVDDLPSLAAASQDHRVRAQKKESGDRDLGIEVTVMSPKRGISHRASSHRQRGQASHKKAHHSHHKHQAHHAHSKDHHSVRNGYNSSDSSDY